MAFYLSSLTHTHRHTHTHTHARTHTESILVREEKSLFTDSHMIWTCEVGQSSGRRGPMIWSSSLLPQVDNVGNYVQRVLAGGRWLRAPHFPTDGRCWNCVVMTTTRAGGQLATLHNQNTCTHILHNSFIAQNGKEITSFLFCGDLVRWGGGRGRVWWFVN